MKSLNKRVSSGQQSFGSASSTTGVASSPTESINTIATGTPISLTSERNVVIECNPSSCDAVYPIHLLLKSVDTSRHPTTWHFMLTFLQSGHGKTCSDGVSFDNMQLSDEGQTYNAGGNKGPWTLNAGQSINTSLTFDVLLQKGKTYSLNERIITCATDNNYATLFLSF